MKKSEIDIQKLREQIRKGLNLTFQKLITQKKLKTASSFCLRREKSKKLMQQILATRPTKSPDTSIFLRVYSCLNN